MSIFFGALGLMSLRKHLRELLVMIFGKGEIRTMFYAVVFLVVCFVLAYLTNPSENSFRAYLTEQSFRQHLSRLDDTIEDDPSGPDDTRFRCNPSSPNRTSVSPCHSRNVETFHFANRASVSLRTPKHVFHSFGIFTIAAMVPLPKSDSTSSDHRDGSMISDSWFIGAFGKWWRGGVIEAWYQDVVARSKDEESWSSGILGIKALDKLNEYNGLPFSTKSLPLRGPTRGSPPRLRNRERVSHRPGALPTRSSTPPPLPKSASLPLHTTRPPSTDHRHSQSAPIVFSQSLPTASEQACIGSPAPSRSPSALFDQSPLIVEVLRQISLSKSAVHDLRLSLTSFQAAATESHALLQGEVDSFRERKRQEDSSRLELKNRTKTLEETKRHAEGAKRDAEKRLKAAQGARDDVSSRMERLNKEIASLQQRRSADEASNRQMKEEALKEEQDISEALEHKKQEIKVAEDVVTALNARAKELEEKISSGRESLRVAKERAEIRKQDRSFLRMHAVNSESTATSAWSPLSFIASYDANSPSRPDPNTFSAQQGHPAGFKDLLTSPRPANLSLGAISNFSPTPKGDEPNHVTLRSKGYSIFDDDFASLDRYPHSTSFAPFGESSALPRNPTAPSNTSSGHMKSLNLAANPFQSDNDNWRAMRLAQLHQGETLNPLSTSPISMHGSSSSGNNNDHDAFEVRALAHDRLNSEPSLDLQRFSLHRTHSNSMSHAYEEIPSSNFIVDRSTGPRRWFSTSSKEKPKKGLNPDAKVFRLSHRKAATVPPAGCYDALNPNGLGSSIMSSTSTNNSLLRAFAPSPAEREVLQRALGGSTNASLERLPSLSDVGSIPSSPAQVHAPIAHVQSARELGKVLPSWLQSLPRMRKSNFSPWDDEEPVESGQR